LPLTFPSVLVIHDLVHLHHPDTFPDRTFAERLGRVIPERAAEATLVACMSEVIRDNDLVGVLGLSPDKVRVVRPAVPTDVQEAGEAPSLGLARPYLFYPAAFRPYKNHRGLILALRALRERYGIDDLDLVFTGQAALPDDLRRLAEDCDLPDRIHVLG